MKKGTIISIFIAVILLFIKYYTSDYNIKYAVDNYDIITKYEDKRLYYEIKKDNEIYNFDIYMKRKLSKTKIEKIKIIEDETFKCIYPFIKDLNTYPLCYENGVYKDFNLISSELLSEYKNEIVNVEESNKDFIYYNNLNEKEYIALWNYKGYIVMNGKSYKNIELFKKDKYDNTLSHIINNKIYVANYDQEHEFNKLISLNLENLKTEEIDIGYNIDYDSYIVGNIKNMLYIFDNKHSILYEINTKKKESKIISNNELGYKKYNGEEFVSCSKSEYKVNKIKYNFDKSIYEYKANEGIYKTIKDNKKLTQLINNKNINIVKEFQNKIYYLDGDNFYIYTPYNGNYQVFYNYEQTFNDKNTVFVYIDN